MKAEVIKQLTWKDLEEIINTTGQVQYEIRVPESLELEQFYKRVLNRLKEKAK